jgi:hypothetical protein
MGRFAPGSSGNPDGRPKDETRVAELARSYTSEAVETLVHLMRHGSNERVPGTAAQAPNIPLGFADIIWTDWWLVLLGVSFVVVTIYAPQGLGGLVDRLAPQRKN